MRNDKKFIVKVVYGREELEMQTMMENLASMLQSSYDIPIVRLNGNKCVFETPKCIVRYVNSPVELIGMEPDEIFGCDPETRAYRRKPSNTLPYEGGILDYILEVEKSDVGKVEERDTGSTGECDILEFLEKFLGSELTDIQRDMVKTFKRLHDDNCKVVYGRGGKIYAVPVEED